MWKSWPCALGGLLAALALSTPVDAAAPPPSLSPKAPPGFEAPAPQLSFEDRLRAQEAIERVLFNHRIWPEASASPKPPFEAVVSREEIALKVERYLKDSVVAEERLGRPITREILFSEAARMKSATKDPATLDELFHALGNDPYLIAETLARQTLASRLAAEFLTNGSGQPTGGAGAAESPNVCSQGWQAMSGTGAPEARFHHSSVWTGAELIVWGGWGAAAVLHSGGRYSPVTDSWSATSTGTGCPSPRDLQTAVWTGTEMIVWGGESAAGREGTGGRYNPVTDSWSATDSGSGCPSPRQLHTAVWTGTEMIVWGGWDGVNRFDTGGRYNPGTDSWTPTSTGTGCPALRADHSAVWTGSEMIVWGGYNGANLDSGARYHPATDSWSTVAASAFAPARQHHSAVWTGSKMIVWGGVDTGTYPWAYFGSGAAYDPSSDGWTPVSSGPGTPSGRYDHGALWTGAEMAVWGGNGPAGALNTGGRYRPGADAWTQTPTDAGCPSSREYATWSWTGAEFVVWGGLGGYGSVLGDGARLSSNIAPVPQVRSVGDFCPTGTLTLTTDPYASYQWIENGADIPGEVGQSILAASPGTYSVRVTDAAGCTATSGPFPMPSLPNPEIAGGPNYCTGQMLMATLGFQSYQWSFNHTPIPGAVTAAYEATANGGYTVTVTDQDGCTGNSAEFAVGLFPLVPEIAGPSTNDCPIVGSATLWVMGGPFTSFQWSKDGVTLPGEMAPFLDVTATGAYRVRAMSPPGCEAESAPHWFIASRCPQACDGWAWADPTPDGRGLLGLAYRQSAGLYVAVGRSGRISASPDGLSWYPQESGTSVDLSGIADGGGLFVAVGASGLILSSPDGFTWTPRASGTTANLMRVRYLAGIFYAAGGGQTLLKSPDGLAWSTIYSGDPSSYFADVAWSGIRFVATGADYSQWGSGLTLSGFLTSPDGLAWSYQTVDVSALVVGEGLNAIAWGASAFAAVGDSGLVLTSPDGLAWTPQQLPEQTTLTSVAWDGARFAAVGYGRTHVSSDGSNWTAKPWTGYPMMDLIRQGAGLVAVGQGGASYTTNDVTVWTRGGSTGAVTDDLVAVTGGDPSMGKPAVTVGSDNITGAGAVWTSPDGVSWARAAAPPAGSLQTVSYGAGEYVAGGNGTFATSANGVAWTAGAAPHSLLGLSAQGPLVVGVGPGGAISTLPHGSLGPWTSRVSGTVQRLRAVTWNRTLGLFAAVGDGGRILTSPDGVGWTSRVSGVSNNLFAVAASGLDPSTGLPLPVQFVTVGGGGRILTSPDGITWTIRVTPVVWALRGVVWAESQFLATAPYGGFLSSPDGVSWNVERTSGLSWAVGLRKDPAPGMPGTVFAAGNFGTILYKAELRTNATASADSGVAPFSTDFFSAPTGGSGIYSSFEWDFGDGSPHAFSQNADHTYAAAGIYQASLSVVDCLGTRARSQLSVRVTDQPPGVYGVPSGQPPQPFSARQQNAAPMRAFSWDRGAAVGLTWESLDCPSVGYHLIYGYGGGMPSWTVSGGACQLGVTGSAAWTGVPDPSTDSSRFLWFLLVGDDGAGEEGSWGQGTGGQERGTGASGQCGFTTRSTTACSP